MATIKDVATRAGVSLATASRVLSGSPRTSAESRTRVLAAASELNYIAHGPARSLRRSRTEVLGLLVSDIRNEFFATLAHAAEREARLRGFTVLLANGDEDQHHTDEYLQLFVSQRVDGLLLSPQGELTPQLASVAASGLPLVLMNRYLEGLKAPMIGTDNAGGVAQALQWLQQRGHHDVAFIGGPMSISTGAERMEAYLAGRQSHGISTSEALIATGDFREEGASQAMHRILDRGVTPTAVFGANGLSTQGAYRALRSRLGVTAASQIDVVSFDDLEWFTFAHPPISAVRNDAAQIGRLGVQALVNLLEGRPAESTRVATSFIDRSGGQS